MLGEEMAILVTGGAGYIGSHTVKYFQNRGEEVIVIDNLSTGHRESLVDVEFYCNDIRDKESLYRILNTHDIRGVIHFAASSIVGESMTHAYEYYHNNVYGTICLLEAMRARGIQNIVFSSTAAVYGVPKTLPIRETYEKQPNNTYGETKLSVEKMLQWFEKSYGIKHVSLRYFNAAGAIKTGEIGEDHFNETHLIPLVLQVPLGKRDKIDVYGTDYDTADGTCVRDYVHVMDLSLAHCKAMDYLDAGNQSDAFNLGCGEGFSVLDVINTAREVTGHPIPTEVKPRRIGDPPKLVADYEKAKDHLNWEPVYRTLGEMVGDAWKWYKLHPMGFGRN